MVFITRDKKTTKRLINFQFNHFAKFLLQIVYSDYKLMSQPTENDRYFVSSSTSPCSIREMSIIFPCHWRAKNVQPRIFHRGHSMLEASVVLEEISTMGRVSHLSLSLSLPLLHLWINNPNPSQQSLLSMAAKMLENAPSSAFWVRISIRRPLEGRGSGPEQRQLSLSLSLSLSFPPSGESQCGSTLYWIMLEHECTISKTRSREVLTEQEGTPCPFSCKRSRSR